MTDDRYYDYEDDDDFEDDAYQDDHEAALLEAFELFSADVNEGVARMAGKLDRRLTASEKEAIVNGPVEQAARGESIDVERVLDSYYEWSGTSRPEMNTTAGRTEYIMQRLAENAPSTVDDDREYDLDDPKDRVAFMEARMQGAEFVDVEEASEWD